MIVRCVRTQFRWDVPQGTVGQFLWRAQADITAAYWLRVMVSQAAPWLDVSRLAVDELAAMAERLLLTRELMIEGKPIVEKRETGGGGVAAASAAAPPPPPPRRAAQQPAAPSQPQEPPTLGSQVNATAQTAALVSAASEGAPFCDT